VRAAGWRSSLRFRERIASSPRGVHMASRELQLRAACRELITTEEAYHDTLTTIVKVFLVPLRQWASEDPDANDASAMERKEMATRTEIQGLFGSVESLMKISGDLCEQLRASTTDNGSGTADPDPAALAHAMLESAKGPLRVGKCDSNARPTEE